MRHLRTLVATAVAVVALAPGAAAHVSVEPAEAARGTDATLTFRVPNERDDAATVALAIELPAGTERVEPGDVAGWTATVEAGVVRWRGGRIEGDGSQAFPLTLGPLPDTDQVVFRAVQTYDSGEVVRWTEGGSGTDRPAPVLRLTGAAPATTVAPTTTAPTTTTTPTEAVEVEGEIDEEGDDGVPVGGLLVGLVVAVLAVASYLLTRRRRPGRS